MPLRRDARRLLSRPRALPGAGSPGRLPPTASASAALTATATTRPWPSRLRRPLRAVELRRRRACGHLLERTDVRGKVITLDATTPATLITRRCGADYVFSVKGNAPETFDILDGIDWEPPAASRRSKAHGRLKQRSIRAAQGPDPGVSQIARIKRYREPPGKSASGAASGNDYTEYIITSLNAQHARGTAAAAATGRWKT